MIEVRVPASTANMGTGFDSFATALNLYNTITVKETEKGLFIRNEALGESFPSNENNLIYRAIMRIFDSVGYEKKGLEISQKSSIPKTRGLGSSSACIVGGMLAANIISGRRLSYKKILDLATEMEGHPDNVAAAMYGGFCVSAKTESGVLCESVKLKKPVRYIAITPEYIVATRKSREQLPRKVDLSDAVHNLSRASGLAVAMATGSYENLREYTEDRLHQPYRARNIDGMYDTFETGYRLGAKAMYLSGSGPTIIAMVEGTGKEFCRQIREYLDTKNKKHIIYNLSADNVGAVVKYKP